MVLVLGKILTASTCVFTQQGIKYINAMAIFDLKIYNITISISETSACADVMSRTGGETQWLADTKIIPEVQAKVIAVILQFSSRATSRGLSDCVHIIHCDLSVLRLFTKKIFKGVLDDLDFTLAYYDLSFYMGSFIWSDGAYSKEYLAPFFNGYSYHSWIIL